MKTQKTELVIILDRSGSMSSIKSDMEGALNKMIEDQKNLPGDCLVSLYQFDDQYEKVFEAINIHDVKNIRLNPRNSTALYDAFCKAIDDVGTRLSKTLEKDRPEKVLVVLITDGLENASREFRVEQVKNRIDHQSKIYSWKFEFLGANQDAVTNGINMGFNLGSSITYSADSIGINNVANSLSSKIGSYRCMSKHDYDSTDINYSETERSAANSDTTTTIK